MCWNADISINTFLFMCLGLLFVFITNTFTKYKSHTFDNPLVYVLLLNVAGVQLAEFFLWRNLKNNSLNETFSRVIANLIAIQPATLMLMIPNPSLRYGLLFSYIVYIVGYVLYKSFYKPVKFYTSVGENGHLNWEWANYKNYEDFFFFITIGFYVAALLSINNFFIALFSFITLIISLIVYLKHDTFGTMWCWTSNLFMLYFIVDILIIKPYFEYNGLC
jgi:hypothetical protein